MTHTKETVVVLSNAAGKVVRSTDEFPTFELEIHAPAKLHELVAPYKIVSGVTVFARGRETHPEHGDYITVSFEINKPQPNWEFENEPDIPVTHREAKVLLADKPDLMALVMHAERGNAASQAAKQRAWDRSPEAKAIAAMPVFWVYYWATSWGDHQLMRARRITEFEKSEWSKDWHDIAMVGMPEESIRLQHISSWDHKTLFGDRLPEGSFRGCDNRAWIIDADKMREIIALDAERQAAKDAAEEDAARAKASHRADTIARAQTSGKPALLDKWVADCDGSAHECSTDIVMQLIDATGKISYERIHTH